MFFQCENSCLHAAAEKHRLAVVKLLSQEVGELLSVRNNKNMLPLDSAFVSVKREKHEVIAYLKSKVCVFTA
jgi:hypothetical protein